MLLDVAGDLGRQLAVDQHDHEAGTGVGVMSRALAIHAVRKPVSGSWRSWMFTSVVYLA